MDRGHHQLLAPYTNLPQHSPSFAPKPIVSVQYTTSSRDAAPAAARPAHPPSPSLGTPGPQAAAAPALPAASSPHLNNTSFEVKQEASDSISQASTSSTSVLSFRRGRGRPKGSGRRSPKPPAASVHPKRPVGRPRNDGLPAGSVPKGPKPKRPGRPKAKRDPPELILHDMAEKWKARCCSQEQATLEGDEEHREGSDEWPGTSSEADDDPEYQEMGAEFYHNPGIPEFSSQPSGSMPPQAPAHQKQPSISIASSSSLPTPPPSHNTYEGMVEIQTHAMHHLSQPSHQHPHPHPHGLLPYYSESLPVSSYSTLQEAIDLPSSSKRRPPSPPPHPTPQVASYNTGANAYITPSPGYTYAETATSAGFIASSPSIVEQCSPHAEHMQVQSAWEPHAESSTATTANAGAGMGSGSRWLDLLHTDTDALLVELIGRLRALLPPPPAEELYAAFESQVYDTLQKRDPNGYPALYSISKTFYLPQTDPHLSSLPYGSAHPPVKREPRASISHPRPHSPSSSSHIQFFFWDPFSIPLSGIHCPDCDLPFQHKGINMHSPKRVFSLHGGYYLIGCEYFCGNASCHGAGGKTWRSWDRRVVEACSQGLMERFPAVVAGAEWTESGEQIDAVDRRLWELVGRALMRGCDEETVLDIIVEREVVSMDEMPHRNAEETVVSERSFVSTPNEFTPSEVSTYVPPNCDRERQFSPRITVTDQSEMYRPQHNFGSYNEGAPVGNVQVGSDATSQQTINYPLTPLTNRSPNVEHQTINLDTYESQRQFSQSVSGCGPDAPQIPLQYPTTPMSIGEQPENRDHLEQMQQASLNFQAFVQSSHPMFMGQQQRGKLITADPSTSSESIPASHAPAGIQAPSAQQVDFSKERGWPQTVHTPAQYPPGDGYTNPSWIMEHHDGPPQLQQNNYGTRSVDPTLSTQSSNSILTPPFSAAHYHNNDHLYSFGGGEQSSAHSTSDFGSSTSFLSPNTSYSSMHSLSSPTKRILTPAMIHASPDPPAKRVRHCCKCGQQDCKGKGGANFCIRPCRDCGKEKCKGRNSRKPDKICSQGWL